MVERAHLISEERFFRADTGTQAIENSEGEGFCVGNEGELGFMLIATYMRIDLIHT